jgi:type IV pilus assembly protein PilC
MPQFLCRVGTSTGEIVERVYTASNEGALRSELADKDLLILSLRRQAGLRLLMPSGGAPRRGRVSAKEFLIFNQEMVSLVKAGLPIIGCLDILIERRKNPGFKNALTDIRDQVRSGVSLSEAFSSHGDLFPSIYSSSLASGERSGEIADVLARYVKYTRTLLALRKKVVSAMVYPAVLLILSVFLIGILILYVLPKFSEFFQGMEAELPLLTVVLVEGSLFLRGHLLLILGSLVAAYFGLLMWSRTSAGQLQMDRTKMRLPLVGAIWKKYSVSRFCRTLGTLLSGGIPLVSALEIASRAVGMRLFSTLLGGVVGRVREGQSLWESLEKADVLTDMAIEMIRVGEQTGSLESMLISVADFYDEEIDGDLATIISLLEPVMLIFMGGIIATILLSIYLPLFRSFSAAQG